MSFKVVLVENDVKITVKLNNLVLTKENDEIWIPVNDISTVVLDNLKISSVCPNAVHVSGKQYSCYFLRSETFAYRILFFLR